MNYLQDYRKSRCITQQQLADELGLTQHVVSRIENDGLRVPYNVFTLFLWCRSHDIDPMALVSPDCVVRHTRTRDRRTRDRHRIAA